MKIKGGVLEALVPPSYVTEGDNTGFQTGCANREINRIIISLKASEAAVSEANLSGAELIITHQHVG